MYDTGLLIFTNNVKMLLTAKLRSQVKEFSVLLPQFLNKFKTTLEKLY